MIGFLRLQRQVRSIHVRTGVNRTVLGKPSQIRGKLLGRLIPWAGSVAHAFNVIVSRSRGISGLMAQGFLGSSRVCRCMI